MTGERPGGEARGPEASARARLFSLDTFPSAALDSAAAAAAAIGARRAAYAVLPLPPPPEPRERPPFAEHARLPFAPRGSPLNPGPERAGVGFLSPAEADLLDGRVDLRARCPRVCAPTP